MKYILFLISCTFCISTLANTSRGGFDVGNGGLVAQCGVGSKWRTLDLLEGHYRGMEYWTELIGLSRQQVLAKVIERANAYCPNHFSQYQKLMKEFSKGAVLATSMVGGLPETTDYVPDLPIDQCSIKQAAFQRQIPDSSGKRFILDREIWIELSPVDQAALIVHEVMYRLFILQYKGGTSNWIRPSVAVLFSENFREEMDKSAVSCERFPKQQSIR
jgi:hypothetical protein